ncbi:MAG TPA: SRPBCC family protein, partial [Ktedonobacterales bacterium]
VLGSPADVFAYLADPCNAGEWFASVAIEAAPSGPPHEGMTWRFVQRLRAGRTVPVRMQVYEFPSRFIWRTQVMWPRSNLAWEMRLESAGPAGESPHPPRTRLRFTITIDPGPVSWVAFVLGAWLSPHALDRRAQGGADRARELLQARSEVSGGRGMRQARESRAARRKGKPGKHNHAPR